MTTTARVAPAPPTTTIDHDYPLSAVPPAARRSLLSLVVVLFGFTFFTPTMLTGAQIGGAFPLTGFLAVALGGSLLLAVYVGVLGGIGARTGLTTVLLARYALGRRGAKWADLLLGGTQIGWYAVTIAFLADLMGRALGWEQHTWVIVLVAGVLMGATSYIGYRGMEVLSAVSVPLMFALAFWVVARSVQEVGGLDGLASGRPGATMSVATALTLVVGAFASGGTQTPNWSRFARRPSHGLVASFVAFLIGHSLMLAFGAVGALAFDEPDLVGVLFQLGLVGAGIALLVLSLWTTNDNAAYAFGVAGAEMFDVGSKKPFVIAGVAIAIVLALTGIYSALEQFLVLLGVLIPPLGGVIIGDHAFTWRGRPPALDEVELRPVRWGPVAAYLLGVAVAWASSRWGIGIPPLQGVLVAGAGVPVFDALLGRMGVAQRHRLRVVPAISDVQPAT